MSDAGTHAGMCAEGPAVWVTGGCLTDCSLHGGEGEGWKGGLANPPSPPSSSSSSHPPSGVTTVSRSPLMEGGAPVWLPRAPDSSWRAHTCSHSHTCTCSAFTHTHTHTHTRTHTCMLARAGTYTRKNTDAHTQRQIYSYTHTRKHTCTDT